MGILLQGLFLKSLQDNYILLQTRSGLLRVYDQDCNRVLLAWSFNPVQIYDTRRPFLFSRNIELRDYNNLLETYGGECSVICFLNEGSKGKKYVNLVRFYGIEKGNSGNYVESPRNVRKTAELGANSNSHSITQVETKYIAVSMDFHIELFDMDLTLIRKIQTNTPF